MACLFCRIVSGEIPAQVVYRGPEVVAFRDINPQAPLHLLIVPSRHIESISDLGSNDVALLGQMIEVANDLARQEGVADSGYRIVTNRGPDAGQTVAHLHFHLLGGRPMTWPPG